MPFAMRRFENNFHNFRNRQIWVPWTFYTFMLPLLLLEHLRVAECSCFMSRYKSFGIFFVQKKTLFLPLTERVANIIGSKEKLVKCWEVKWRSRNSDDFWHKSKTVRFTRHNGQRRRRRRFDGKRGKVSTRSTYRRPKSNRATKWRVWIIDMNTWPMIRYIHELLWP